MNKQSEAQTVFQQSQDLIPVPRKDLQSQLELAEGRCAALVNRALAKEHYAKAARLAHGEDSFVEGIALLNLGFMLLQEDNYEESIEQLKRVPSVTDSTYVRERALGNLGFIYSQLGDWRRAISFSEQAEAMAEEINSRESQENWLTDLGKAHFALWELAEAESAYLRALSAARELQDRAKVALCLHNLAFLSIRQNSITKADEYRKQGEALKVDGERLHFALDAAEIAAARREFKEAEQSLEHLVPQTRQDPVLQSFVQRDLGKVLWQEKKVVQADQAFRRGITTAERALAQLKRPEYRMSFMDQDPFYDSYIQFLVAQNRPADALKVAERGRAQVLAAALENGRASDPTISVPALQALSKRRNQIFLSYAMTDEKTFLWVITPSVFKLLELPGHAQSSSPIIASSREIQGHLGIDQSPAGSQLYETLIRPAEKLIPKGSSVVIVPSKLLSMVNFEALVVPGTQPHYWIDDVAVEVAGSLALLAKAPYQRRPASTGSKELLALGAPVEATKDYPILQHAPEEIQRVQNHFPLAKTTVIAGQEATPQAYRTSNPGRYRFIHLDTHGVPSDMNPLESAIILSPGSDNGYKLTADQIKDIPLHADLVTISACYGSGTRWYQGEGLVGLAWAFMRAGAHQVVGALWEVDEASSPQLMDDFYGELTQGKSATEALRDAKLKMLHSNTFYRHPYYWASLQLYTGS